ncbi:MAG TPA: class I SAM-dependent methyltransferase [Candidatus Polarisedimenticolaceae bacterium]|nr:class I SAM-dependent methyltransferase [Candidatus Polarisedimenticolaceae bacterium]
MSVERIRADFDRIASLASPDDEEDGLYHAFLLARLPERIGAALDVGCGTGAFARKLAARAARVEAIDLSPEMIRVASSRSPGLPHLAFREADVSAMALAPASYDAIATLATLHHLDADAVVPRLVSALRPGGTLAILDLLAVVLPREIPRTAAAMVVSRWRRWRATGRVRKDRETARAWREHGRNDVLPTWPEARAMRDRLLPGGRLTRHLLWRYSIVWTKPVG